MPIKSIHIEHFRCFESLDITLSPDINIFYGLNASGKTALLESFFYLSRAKSFKSITANKLIQLGMDKFILIAEINQFTRLAMMKPRSKTQFIKIDSEFVVSLSDVYHLLPLQIIDTQSISLIDGSPSIRRKYIDWIVFHVKHHLIDDWKKYRKVIRNRNHALKHGFSIQEIQAWNSELILHSEKINEARKYFIDRVNEKLKNYRQDYLSFIPCYLEFYQGWDTKFSYADILQKNLQYEIKRGHTKEGIHKADFYLKVNHDKSNFLAKEILSNGQKKLIAFILYVIQLEIYLEEIKSDSQYQPVILIDDITSELDMTLLTLLFDYILSLNIQIIITILETRENLQLVNEKLIHNKYKKNVKLFHIKQSAIREITTT